MRNIDESVKDINQMLIEMIKSSERMLKLTLEILKGDILNKELYGEAKVLEEELNEYQIKMDEKVVETIAMYQPAAYDLRFLISVMHMNTDLERIGDLSIGTIKMIKHLFREIGENNKEIVPITQMGEKVVRMYELFVRGYIDKKVENGYIILGLDDEIDLMKKEHISAIKGKIKENIDYLDSGIENIFISKNYERIADNITNLAESLVYIHKGEDLRHSCELRNKRSSDSIKNEKNNGDRG